MQLPSVALMELCVWLVDHWRVQAEWRSASMEHGGQCVMIDGITVMPKLCADNWATVSIQVNLCIGKTFQFVMYLKKNELM